MTEENKNEVAVKNQEVATQVQGSNYISVILEETHRGFLEANDGMDIDFVHLGDWLTINKKGQFIEKEDPDVNYGDEMDIVIAKGEKRHMLWGKQDSPEEGQLIVADQNLENAEAAFAAWLEENPDRAEDYALNDIKLRYLAYVVPVQELGKGDFPPIYLMSFSPTDTIEYGKWAMGIFKGKGKDAGIPRGTGVNKIVTRLVTVEKVSRNNPNVSYTGLKFVPVGLFKPEDYGINE